MKSHCSQDKTTRLLLLTFLICATACSVAPQSKPAPAEASSEIRAGAKLFAQHCASCHGANATGGRGPALHTLSVHSMPDAALVKFLTDGDLRKGMPSWSRLPEERRWQLVRYIKSL
ncbi:MAG TPA: cytochrome c [Thermoanaerobaculia bacterium]|jgi:mono/diheme cytochrome c family protein|nr:cytochrome c [Thermoanaerobaculia bacterium]